ncbi:MAG: hypothetical protein QF805_26815 [Pirellulaceae bacterium]|nr:hypothetical protein [Pirellulaceae bacterium]
MILISDRKTSAGWRASVQYSSVNAARFHINLFGRALPTRSVGVNAVNLVNPALQTGTQRSKDRRVTVSLGTALHSQDELAQQAADVKSVLLFFRSAESLRDESLRRLDLLEAKLRRQIEAGEGFTETDWSQVRSDNPPRHFPRPLGPLAKDEAQICLQRAMDNLEQRRAVIKEHYQSIHEAVAGGFPFLEVIEAAEIVD